jgi:hypothetical protein
MVVPWSKLKWLRAHRIPCKGTEGILVTLLIQDTLSERAEAFLQAAARPAIVPKRIGAMLGIFDAR